MKTLVLMVGIMIGIMATTTVSAQTWQDKIVEDGVTYYPVKTVSDLEKLGFVVSTGDGGTLTANSSGHNRKANYTCGKIKGGCWCALDKVSGDNILSTSLPVAKDAKGNVLPGISGVLPYNNDEYGVIWR